MSHTQERLHLLSRDPFPLFLGKGEIFVLKQEQQQTLFNDLRHRVPILFFMTDKLCGLDPRILADCKLRWIPPRGEFIERKSGYWLIAS